MIFFKGLKEEKKCKKNAILSHSGFAYSIWSYSYTKTKTCSETHLSLT